MTLTGSDAPEPIWTPDAETVAAANVTSFARWCARRGAPVIETDYASLWKWSVGDIAAFWAAIWEYFEVRSPTPWHTVVSGQMPAAQWFEGAHVNYVEHLFANAQPGQVAIVSVGEPADAGAGRDVRHLTWEALRAQVAGLAASLRGLGVRPGDRVVGYLPNTAEAVVAFLASACIGAVWASCGQDYAPEAAAARLAPLEPVVLVAADGYRHGGKPHDRTAAVRELRQHLPGLRATIVLSRIAAPRADDEGEGILRWGDATSGRHELRVTPVPFGHPLWVLFSSGTTGKPKGIVHSHGGVLLEHLKAVALQFDLGPGSTFFWYTSPSWMVWNHLISGLLVGARIVCYDGSPVFPGPAALWAIAAEQGVSFLGTSPAYLAASAKAGVRPAHDHDLSGLRTIGSSGSPLPADAYRWAAKHVGPAVQVVSTSGGTDIVSAFAGATPTVPVWPGELSAPSLGVALDAWDEAGQSLRDAVGELVVTKPMPSMPVSFWNDPDGSLYHGAYFATYPGVWRHGDWITITARNSVIVHGRSDATLNRNGVRIGTAEIYRVVERLPQIAEALVVGVEQPDGSYWMPMFVQLATGTVLDDTLTGMIRTAIREEASPRHVPDDIFAAPAIPHTRTGKKLEVPIKRLLQGAATARMLDPRAADNPAAVQWFTDFHEDRLRTHAMRS